VETFWDETEGTLIILIPSLKKKKKEKKGTLRQAGLQKKKRKKRRKNPSFRDPRPLLPEPSSQGEKRKKTFPLSRKGRGGGGCPPHVKHTNSR